MKPRLSIKIGSSTSKTNSSELLSSSCERADGKKQFLADWFPVAEIRNHLRHILITIRKAPVDLAAYM